MKNSFIKIIFFFALLYNSSLTATENIIDPQKYNAVFFISFEKPITNQSDLPKKAKEFIENIDKILEETFKSRLENLSINPVIIFDPDVYSIYTIIKNPFVNAIFWVSHGASEKKIAIGINVADNVVLDKNGFNIAEMFRSINPNVNFFGLITCYSKKILENMEKDGFFEDKPNLTTFGIYGQVLNPNIALKKALNKFKCIVENKKEFLDNSFETRYLKKGLPIKITRQTADTKDYANYPALGILQNGKIIGMLPKGEKGESQSITVYADFNLDKKDVADLNISVTTFSFTLKLAGTLSFGDITVKDFNDTTYKPFTSSNGKYIGVAFHKYFYKGKIPSESDFEEYESY